MVQQIIYAFDGSGGVCKTAADYLPNHSFDAGGGNMMTCDAWGGYVGFTDTPQCDGQSGQGDTTWKQPGIRKSFQPAEHSLHHN